MTPPSSSACCPDCGRELYPDPKRPQRDAEGHFPGCGPNRDNCGITLCRDFLGIWQRQVDCRTCNGLPTTVQPRLQRDPPTSVRPASPPVVATTADPVPRAAVLVMARNLYLSYRSSRRADKLDAGAAGLPATFDELGPRQQPRFIGMAKTAFRTMAAAVEGLADE